MEEEKTKNAIRGSFSNIAPNQRFCYKCGQIIFHKIYVKLQLYFDCFSCNTSTFWAEGSIFSSKCISLSTLENLLHLYLRNKSKQETIDDMKFTYGIQIAKMTVSKYFALFDQVILKYYEECHKKKIYQVTLKSTKQNYISKKFQMHVPVLIATAGHSRNLPGPLFLGDFIENYIILQRNKELLQRIL